MCNTNVHNYFINDICPCIKVHTKNYDERKGEVKQTDPWEY